MTDSARVSVVGETGGGGNESKDSETSGADVELRRMGAGRVISEAVCDVTGTVL